MSYDERAAAELVRRELFRELLAYALPFATAGVPSGQCMLGAIHQLGLGVAPDGATAEHWYQLAAAQGDGVAWNNLGTLHRQRAAGATGEEALAKECYRRARQLGFRHATAEDGPGETG